MHANNREKLSKEKGDQMKKKDDSQLIMYTTADGKTKVRVQIDPKENTVWLTQDKIAELFGRDRTVITKHLKDIFASGELDEKSNVQKMHIANSDKPVKIYRLDAVIAVGYRVNSLRGTQFRIWATQVLHEYIKKGFAMNDDLLKEAGGGNYFKELLQRIRDIRSSEKVFYRQILEIYATSIDYDSKAETTIEFFKIVQNKMHFAVHGKTAAEMIVDRANAELPFMGLTAFKGNQPMKSEVTTAKNYLSEDEIKELNLLSSMFLDHAEDQARLKIAMHMKDWVAKLDEFIKFTRRKVLSHAGQVSHKSAVEHAEQEYGKYKDKTGDELTAVERDFLETIQRTYKLLEGKK
jgi:hypothetical protein